MKLRLLGSGTSAGVPRLGRHGPDWGACDPADPRNRRRRVAALIEDGEQRLLIDCGPDLREQLLDAAVTCIDRIYVTHDHADHCHGIDELRPIAQAMKATIPLHARPDVLTSLDSRFGYVFRSNEFYRAMLDAVACPAGTDAPLGAMRITTIDQPHGAITSMGLRVDGPDGSIVYATDYHAATDEMRALYAGASLFVSDCLRREPHPTHMHLDAVLGLARELGVGQLVLTHLDKSMDHATLAAALPDWAAPGHDGLEIDLCR